MKITNLLVGEEVSIFGGNFVFSRCLFPMEEIPEIDDMGIFIEVMTWQEQPNQLIASEFLGVSPEDIRMDWQVQGGTAEVSMHVLLREGGKPLPGLKGNLSLLLLQRIFSLRYPDICDVDAFLALPVGQQFLRKLSVFD